MTPLSHGDDGRAKLVQASHLSAPFFVRGDLVTGNAITYKSRDLGVEFATPALDLNAIVRPRSELPPLLEVKLSEIIDFLVETGERLRLERNPHLQQCLELVAATNPLPRRVVENLYHAAPHMLSRSSLVSMVESNFADSAILDGWVERRDEQGNTGRLRAFPPRMIHMLAGNAPAGCIASIAQGALVKAVNLFKMPSSDPFTTVAVLRTMAEIDPDHPVVRSMTAVYWRGGDEQLERTIYRPQYFDRVVAWGGGDAISSVMRYIGPGLQLVSFDPKSSISMIGREALLSESEIDEAAERAAQDITVFNQEACLASRFIFIEGDRADVERFCSRLADRISVDRTFASAKAPGLPLELRDEINMLDAIGEAKTWGSNDGAGLVVLTEQPVEFHPSNKTSNVVHVDSLQDAIRYVNVATQTIGVWPAQRKEALRDRIAAAGGQRICCLGTANLHVPGGPHDAMFALQRFVKFIGEDDIAGRHSNPEFVAADGSAQLETAAE